MDKPLFLPVPAHIDAILHLDAKTRNAMLTERINEMKDWYIRIKRNRGEYSLKDCTIKTMMQMVEDSLVIADYFKFGTLRVKKQKNGKG